MFRGLVLARIIEPTSKLDSLRVLEEVGIAPPSYATVKRGLPMFAKPAWRQALAAACAEHTGLGPASLVLYDVSTLYFETDAADGFPEPGFSKEPRNVLGEVPLCEVQDILAALGRPVVQSFQVAPVRPGDVVAVTRQGLLA